MSRSGYSEDCDDNWSWIRWRGTVKASIQGRRGQAFLKELLAAMDALPEQRLVKDALEVDGAVCAIGAVGKARGLDMSLIDADDHEHVAAKFGITRPLAQEIMWANDDAFWRATPDERFIKMRE